MNLLFSNLNYGFSGNKHDKSNYL